MFLQNKPAHHPRSFTDKFVTVASNYVWLSIWLLREQSVESNIMWLFSFYSNEHCYIRKPNIVQRESSLLSANKPSWKYIETQLMLFIGEIDDSTQIEFSNHMETWLLYN